jgi:hypothetical protein
MRICVGKLRSLVKHRLLFATAFLALGVLGHPAPASAGLTVCNDTSHQSITVAWAATWYGIYQTLQSGSQGWFVDGQNGGHCGTLTSVDISHDDIYIYAYVTSDPSIKWSGKYHFCLDPKSKFTYDGASSRLPVNLELLSA